LDTATLARDPFITIVDCSAATEAASPELGLLPTPGSSTIVSGTALAAPVNAALVDVGAFVETPADGVGKAVLGVNTPAELFIAAFAR